MHSYNYIPACKSIRIHREVLSDWSEFKSLSFEAASYRKWIRYVFQANVILLLNFLQRLDKTWSHYL